MSFRLSPRVVPLILSVAALGYVSGCDVVENDAGCRLSPQLRLESLDRGRYTGLELVETAQSTVAIWSRPDGTFARRLAPSGAPTAAAQRVGATCDGGLAAAASGDSILLTCLTGPQPEQGKSGQLLALRLDRDLEVLERAALRPLEGAAAGVDVEALNNGWVLVWNDGGVGGARIWRGELNAALDFVAPPTMVSSGRVHSGAPHLLVHGEEALVTWTETWTQAGVTRGQVVVHNGRQLPRQAAETRFEFPLPSLGQDEDGLFVAFRDIRPPYRKSGLYLQRLDARLRPVGEAKRAGRANGRGRPCLRSCAGNLFGASPRTWSRDYIIGVNLFDGQFEQRIRERQVYEFGHRFNDVATACSGDDLLLLVAEERTLTHQQARLATVTLRCD